MTKRDGHHHSSDTLASFAIAHSQPLNFEIAHKPLRFEERVTNTFKALATEALRRVQNIRPHFASLKSVKFGEENLTISEAVGK